MTQEIQVILTLDVDTVTTKEFIKQYFEDVSSVFNLVSIEVKEEKDIYKNE